MEQGLNSWIDFTVIGIYFGFVIVVGILSMCRKNRESVKGYFLAGRTMHWIPIGASLFASNIGSEHFVGLAGSGAASGIAVVAFEWGAVAVLVLLGWFFLPIYLSAQVFTIPEYIGRRFGGYRMRIYLSLLALLIYVLTKVSVDVYAGGVFIQQATGWDLYVSMVPLLLLTALYTMAGGLAAVVFTDTLQTVIMMTGAVVLAAMAYAKVGGLGALFEKYMQAVPHSASGNQSLDSFNVTSNSTCGIPLPDALHIFRDPVTSDLPWPGVLIRCTLVGVWYWCADQVIVQRALSARSMAHAKAATLMAGFLKISPLFLIIFPGMISRVLYPDLVACDDPERCVEVCNNPSGCSNIAYPLLILKMAPTGMRGLLMAVMVAALMSSLTSVFNSAGTIFTLDIWRKMKPHSSERQLLLVGRLFVVVLAVVSVAWIPLVVGSQKGQLFIYIQAVTGYVAPPICSVFLLAIFVPRVNETGAFWGVIAGQATGFVRLVLDFVYPSPGCGHVDTRPLVVSQVNFTYFSGIVLLVTAVVTVLVSFTRPPQPQAEIQGLTWWSLKSNTGKRKHVTTGNAELPEDNQLSSTTDDCERYPEVEKDQSQHSLSNGGEETDFTNTLETFDPEVPLPWRYVLDAGAVLLLALLVFLFAFFA